MGSHGPSIPTNLLTYVLMLVFSPDTTITRPIMDGLLQSLVFAEVSPV